MKIMRKAVFGSIFSPLFIMALPVLAFTQEPPPSVQFPEPIPAEQLWLRGFKPLPIEKAGQGIFRIGEINIDKTKKSISFPAVVNMNQGLLEYLIVRAGGKTHESLLRTTCEPYNLQLAFLLLGFEGTDRPLAFQGDPGAPKGEAVDISIEYVKPDGKSQNLRPEQWLEFRTDSGKSDVKKIDWVYTGSIVTNGRFLAQGDGSIIALYHDPAAMIDNASLGGESDKIWFVKEGSVLPIGTAVTVTIRAKK